MTQAIVVEGAKRGELLNICATLHAPFTTRPRIVQQMPSASNNSSNGNGSKELRDKAHQHNRKFLHEVVKKAPAALKRADFEMLVLAFIEGLSIDDFEVLAEQYKIDTEKVRTDQDLG